ncbi:MAG: hypothetical protein P9X22_02680 [Candidatus Zapsychrus exili]|nr:hypothetical protein [Candidatus Zapsychrus exili]
MQIKISKECQDFSERLEILPKTIASTFVNKTQGLLIKSTPAQIYAIKWFGGNRIILTNGIITKHQKQESGSKILEITAKFAIELKETLPYGIISKNMKMPKILNAVAKSFGVPVTCHKEEQPSKIYNGKWDGKTIKFKLNKNDHYQVSGSFNPKTKTCKNVWVFSFNEYKKWFHSLS